MPSSLAIPKMIDVAISDTIWSQIKLYTIGEGCIVRCHIGHLDNDSEKLIFRRVVKFNDFGDANWEISVVEDG